MNIRLLPLGQWAGSNLGFPEYYLMTTHLALVLSAWMLVMLFAHLRRYSQRDYLTIWTFAWLFFAGWQTLGVAQPASAPESFFFVLRQWFLGTSAVLLLWGSLKLLACPPERNLMVLFLSFFLVWSCVSVNLPHDSLLLQVPVLLMFCCFSLFVAFGRGRWKRDRSSVGPKLLALGTLLWGAHLVTYPLVDQHSDLRTVGLLASTVLQLCVALAMMMQLIEEIHANRAQPVPGSEAVPTAPEQPAQQGAPSGSKKSDGQPPGAGEAELKPDETQNAQASEDWEKAYCELRARQPALLREERLQATRQMAGVIAHDLSNLLSPIVAFSEMLLQRRPALDEPIQQSLGQILGAGEEVSSMIDRMREFYRRRELSPLQPLDLNRIVQKVIEVTRPQWRQERLMEGIRVEVRTELSRSLPLFPGHEEEIQQALKNLVLNATDALPRGGEIIIATRPIRQETPEAGTEPSHLMVEVRDNGEGMDAYTRQHCLEPFFSTKGHRGGKGLGLATVYGTMERHGGRIEIETLPGKGTSVRLIFPRRELPVSKPNAPALVDLSPRPLRLLCVDDEQVVGQLLKQLLESKGHEVVVASDGPSALEAFRQSVRDGNPFEAVVTDLAMPGMDGRQVTFSVKAQSPHTPVVLLSGYGTIEGDVEAQSPTPVDGILSKPPRIEDLNRMLAQLTQKPRAQDPGPAPVGPLSRN